MDRSSLTTKYQQGMNGNINNKRKTKNTKVNKSKHTERVIKL